MLLEQPYKLVFCLGKLYVRRQGAPKYSVADGESIQLKCPMQPTLARG
jgi:hypothetical protein